MNIFYKRITEQDEQRFFDRKKLLLLLIPLIIEQTLTSLMGVADTLMVASIGESAVSGVSCIDTLNVLVLVLFEAVAVGGNVVCAQYCGRKDRQAIRSAVKQLYAIQLAFSLIVTVILVAFTGSIITMLYPALEGQVYEEAYVYLKITALSSCFLGVYTASAALYRAVGNSKLPVTVITTGNLLNIAGNALLIFGLQLGVAGAAWATLGSRVFSCVVLLLLQYKDISDISLKGINNSVVSLKGATEMLRIGIPTAVENGVFQLGKIVMQTIVVTLGTTAIASQAIITQMETLASRPATAVCIGLLTIAGQCIGAGRADLAKSYTKRLMRWAFVCCLITGVITLAMLPAVYAVSDFSAEAETLIFRLLLFIAVIKLFLWPASFLLIYCLKAAGDVKFPMWVSNISMWVFRIGGAYILCKVFSLGLWGVWIAWISDWLVRGITFTIRFEKGKWEKMYKI